MKAFIFAVVAAIVLTAATAFVLEGFQSTSDRANTTAGARIDYSKDGVSGGNLTR